MHVEMAGPLLSFLLVLARVAGVFVFFPIPGVRQGPDMARAALAVAFTLALYPRWPEAAAVNAGGLVLAIMAEAALGVAAGLAVAFTLEAFVMSMQVVGLEAGFSYAVMIDPTTDADSGVLLVLAQLFGGLLFFAFGLDGAVFRALARSLETVRLGSFAPSQPVVWQILRMGAEMFSTGVRLALPVMALLILVDVSLALLGRVNAQLQLLTLAFPVKMLATLAVLAWTAAVLPRVFTGSAESLWRTLGAVMGR